MPSEYLPVVVPFFHFSLVSLSLCVTCAPIFQLWNVHFFQLIRPYTVLLAINTGNSNSLQSVFEREEGRCCSGSTIKVNFKISFFFFPCV